MNVTLPGTGYYPVCRFLRIKNGDEPLNDVGPSDRMTGGSNCRRTA